MPKRTNPFQRLVRAIEAQIAPPGSTVTESAMLRDRNGNLREVDILVVGKSGIREVRWAIECQDRARKGDSPWIDALIGKYQDIPEIDMVVAVAERGFTKPAEKKARAHRIRTLRLDGGRLHAWVREILSRADGPSGIPGLVKFTATHLRPLSIEFRAAVASGQSVEVRFEDGVEDPNGHRRGFEAVAQSYLDASATRDQLKAIDPDATGIRVDVNVPLEDWHVVDVGGNRHPLDGFVMTVQRVRDSVDIPLRQASYGDAHTSTGQGMLREIELTVTSVQTKEAPEQAPLAVSVHPTRPLGQRVNIPWKLSVWRQPHEPRPDRAGPERA